MNKKTVYRYNNSPIFIILGIVFIVLKLTGVITWSWLWVTAPLWIPFAIIIFLFTIFVVFGFLFVSASHFIGKVTKK